MNNSILKKIDWLSILLYIALVAIGWINIYSASYTNQNISLFNLDTLYGKQLFFIIASVILIIFILAIDAKFYERFAGIIYLFSLASLLGLFIFGKNINGATSWYAIGGMTLQPSEFVKTATTLALAKYLSDIQTNIYLTKHQLYALAIIVVPTLFIISQPDPGSALVFFSLFFVLYREGLPFFYLLIGFIAILIFAFTLMFGTVWIALGTVIILILLYSFKKRKQKRVRAFPYFIIFLAIVGFSLSVQFIFDHAFEQHHRDRFNLWLRLEEDPEKLQQIKKTIGYNTHQSEEAIGSGGLWGKGFLEGTRTKGNFVPEQPTDYIFSTVGEEWGFAGSTLVIVLFILLFIRLLFLAERQKSNFSRMYGYGIVSILFFHFAINIGMVIGLLPTIGIPLPFFSYGGSGLWGFTILLFIFLKLDANRIHDWL